MTKMFQYNLVKSQKTPETYVLPEGNDDRIIIAAARLLKWMWLTFHWQQETNRK
jgi:phosphotransacetylase